MNHTENEAEIVIRVKQGDNDAFSLLMRRYRDTAINWANQIVHDAHLAEDVAQEAFFRLLNKIDSLQDPTRFRTWFRQMVRRLAINQIRKNRHDHVQNYVVLEYEMPSLTVESKNTPLQDILHRENEEEILNNALRSLSKQARSLMQSYAVVDDSPNELAKQFQMTTSNVYNIISRSRMKANDERFRLEMERYLTLRRKSGKLKENMLIPPVFSSPYSTLSVALYEVLKYAGEDNWTLTDIMGISGDAFRLNMTSGSHWRGISTFDWSYATYRTMERLGWQVKCFGRPNRPSVTPEQQSTMLEIIQASIDKGLPAIVWNLIINEFGLIYGYDDASRVLHYQGFRRVPETIEYSRFGRNIEEPAIFVAAIGNKVSGPTSKISVISTVIEHVKGKEPAISGFVFGLAGYQFWLDSVLSENLDLLGHAYQVAILCECRRHAVLYLQDLAENARYSEEKIILSNASECYMRAEQSLRSLYPSFPFGYGGSHAGRITKIAQGLQSALEAEREGSFFLEQIKIKNFLFES